MAIAFQVYTQNNWKQSLEEYLYTYVHSSIIHGSQEVETIQLVNG